MGIFTTLAPVPAYDFVRDFVVKRGGIQAVVGDPLGCGRIYLFVWDAMLVYQVDAAIWSAPLEMVGTFVNATLFRDRLLVATTEGLFSVDS